MQALSLLRDAKTLFLRSTCGQCFLEENSRRSLGLLIDDGFAIFKLLFTFLELFVFIVLDYCLEYNKLLSGYFGDFIIFTALLLQY